MFFLIKRAFKIESTVYYYQRKENELRLSSDFVIDEFDILSGCFMLLQLNRIDSTDVPLDCDAWFTICMRIVLLLFNLCVCQAWHVTGEKVSNEPLTEWNQMDKGNCVVVFPLQYTTTFIPQSTRSNCKYVMLTYFVKLW